MHGLRGYHQLEVEDGGLLQRSTAIVTKGFQAVSSLQPPAQTASPAEVLMA